MNHTPGFLSLVEKARQSIKEVHTNELLHMIDTEMSFHLIDIREDEEWRQGRIPGARHISRGILERDIERIIPDRKAHIVLYCGGGYRSALSAHSLKEMGYENVFSFFDGWTAWKKAKLPIEGS